MYKKSIILVSLLTLHNHTVSNKQENRFYIDSLEPIPAFEQQDNFTRRALDAIKDDPNQGLQVIKQIHQFYKIQHPNYFSQAVVITNIIKEQAQDELEAEFYAEENPTAKVYIEKKLRTLITDR